MSGINTKDMSRISCVTCRSKKMKCDRQLPTCHFCETKHILCEYPPDNKNMSQRSVQRRRKLGKLRYYGCNSVNHTLSEANKVFFNRDFEVEKERVGEALNCFHLHLYIRIICQIKEAYSQNWNLLSIVSHRQSTPNLLTFRH